MKKRTSKHIVYGFTSYKNALNDANKHKRKPINGIKYGKRYKYYYHYKGDYY